MNPLPSKSLSVFNAPLKNKHGRLSSELLDLDDEADHYGAWSRNAMMPMKPRHKTRPSNNERRA